MVDLHFDDPELAGHLVYYEHNEDGVQELP